MPRPLQSFKQAGCLGAGGTVVIIPNPKVFVFVFCFLRGAMQGDECLNHFSLINRHFNLK